MADEFNVDPLASLRTPKPKPVRGVEVGEEQPEELVQAERVQKDEDGLTPAQKRMRDRRRISTLTSSPLVSLGLWTALIGGSIGVIVLVKAVMSEPGARVAQAAGPTTDYQQLYERELANRVKAEEEMEAMVRAQVRNGLEAADRSKPAQPSPLSSQKAPGAASDRRLPPAPPGNTRPLRTVYLQANNQPSANGLPVLRARVSAAERDPRVALANIQINEDFTGTGADTRNIEDRASRRSQAVAQVSDRSGQGTPSFATDVSTSRVARLREFRARLTSRVQWIGGRSSAIPVRAEVLEDVRSQGRVALPAGTILVGQLTRVDSYGQLEIQFVEGKLPGEDGEPFNLQAIALDLDGGGLQAEAPRRPDPAAADLAQVGSSFIRGAASYGLTTITNGNYGYGGYNNSVVSQTAPDPLREGARQAAETGTAILSNSANEARQVSRSGNLDYLLRPGREIKVMVTADLQVPYLGGQ